MKEIRSRKEREIEDKEIEFKIRIDGMNDDGKEMIGKIVWKGKMEGIDRMILIKKRKKSEMEVEMEKEGEKLIRKNEDEMKMIGDSIMRLIEKNMIDEEVEIILKKME